MIVKRKNCIERPTRLVGQRYPTSCRSDKIRIYAIQSVYLKAILLDMTILISH